MTIRWKCMKKAMLFDKCWFNAMLFDKELFLQIMKSKNGSIERKCKNFPYFWISQIGIRTKMSHSQKWRELFEIQSHFCTYLPTCSERERWIFVTHLFRSAFYYIATYEIFWNILYFLLERKIFKKNERNCKNNSIEKRSCWKVKLIAHVQKCTKTL